MSKDSLIQLNIYDTNRLNIEQGDSLQHIMVKIMLEFFPEKRLMDMSEERIKMIGQMALDAGLLENPQWLDRLNEPVPLWVVLDLLLRSIDRIDRPNEPFD